MVSPSPRLAGRSYSVFRSAGSNEPDAPWGTARGGTSARCDHQRLASSRPAAPATSSSIPARKSELAGRAELAVQVGEALERGAERRFDVGGAAAHGHGGARGRVEDVEVVGAQRGDEAGVVVGRRREGVGEGVGREHDAAGHQRVEARAIRAAACASTNVTGSSAATGPSAVAPATRAGTCDGRAAERGLPTAEEREAARA